MNKKNLLTSVVSCGFVAVVLSFLIFAVLHGVNDRHAAAKQLPLRGDPTLRLANTTPVDWDAAYGKLPLAFEKNQGQTDRTVRYTSQGRGYALLLTAQGAILSMRHASTHDNAPLRLPAHHLLEAEKTAVVHMNLEGANPRALIEPTDRLPGRTNYFIGNDRKNWHTDVVSYARVNYSGVYPGVDLVFYGNQGRLEYDFMVAAGADPSVIKMKLEGADEMHINPRGDLVLSVSGEAIELQKPIIYQDVAGTRREIEGKYLVSQHHDVSFEVANYDRRHPLVIDPVLNYSTYLGGSGNDSGNGIAVDLQGDAFVTGTTFSTNFPATATAFNKGPLTVNPNGAVFVTELNPAGTQQLYSTYLAGTGGDSGLGVAVDPAGKVYVTGQTSSINFPTTSNALKPGPLVVNASGTSFVSKIDPTLSGAASLVYSSYLGGTSGDSGSAIAADAAGNAYVTGVTFSAPGSGLTAFPTTSGAFQSTLSNASGDAFLSRIDTTKSGTASLIYSSYLGGDGIHASTAGLGFGDGGFGIAVDATGSAYLVGVTTSSNFPTTATAFKITAPLAATLGTAFVAKIDTSGISSGAASLRYSTYLGGEKSDFGLAIALGPANVAYVTGTTVSLAFPTFPAGAFKTTGSASGSSFISLIDTALTGSTSLKYSTYLGLGTGSGIKADSTGRAYVAGGTSDASFPVTPGAFQPTIGSGATAGFISQLNPGGNGVADLVYSTFFGGSGASTVDSIQAMTIDSSNNIYVTGVTHSATTFPVFPKPGAFQTTLAGASDAFVAKLTPVRILTLSAASLNLGTQLVGTTSAAQTVTLTNNSNTPQAITSIAVSAGSPAASNVDFAISSNTCGASVLSGASCTVGITLKPSVAAAESATLVLTAGGFASSVALSGTGTNVAPLALAPASLNFGTQTVGTTSVAQTVTVTNSSSSAQPITNIAVVAGTPAASGIDFAISSNTCGTSVAAVSACVVGVTLNPSVAAAESATLVLTASGLSSPLSASLSGTGSAQPADFTVTAPASLNVAQGASGNVALTVTSVGGFANAVALSCSGAPSLATCSISPASVTPAANGTATATLTVTTTAASLVAPHSIRIPPISTRQILTLFLALAFVFLLSSSRKLKLQLGMATGLLVFLAVIGCGSSTSTTHSAGTPKGTTNITVTGVSGNETHTATVALTVN